MTIVIYNENKRTEIFKNVSEIKDTGKTIIIRHEKGYIEIGKNACVPLSLFWEDTIKTNLKENRAEIPNSPRHEMGQ